MNTCLSCRFIESHYDYTANKDLSKHICKITGEVVKSEQEVCKPHFEREPGADSREDIGDYITLSQEEMDSMLKTMDVVEVNSQKGD